MTSLVDDVTRKSVHNVAKLQITSCFKSSITFAVNSKTKMSNDIIFTAYCKINCIKFKTMAIFMKIKILQD